MAFKWAQHSKIWGPFARLVETESCITSFFYICCLWRFCVAQLLLFPVRVDFLRQVKLFPRKRIILASNLWNKLCSLIKLSKVIFSSSAQSHKHISSIITSVQFYKRITPWYTFELLELSSVTLPIFIEETLFYISACQQVSLASTWSLKKWITDTWLGSFIWPLLLLSMFITASETSLLRGFSRKI